MEYELKALERIVSVILHPNRLKPRRLDAAFIGKYKRLAHLEKERIKIQFIKAAFEPGSENRIELYYRQHQNSLIQLADDIFYFQNPNNTESSYRKTNDVAVIKFYKEFHQCLEYLLNFIESQFPKYFDHDAKIPEAQRWMIAPEIKSNLKYLQIAFKKNEVPDDLIKIACHPLEDYFLPEAFVTYQELKFIKELQQALINLANKKDKNNYTDQLCSLLLHLNFNSIRFFNFHIAQILEKGKSYNNTNDLIEYYSKEMKSINQLIVKPGCVYKTDLFSLREQIGSWISEELYFLEKRQQILQLPVYSSAATANEPKVHTSLSVAHLSLAVKLLIDAKVIKNKNSTELMKLVARNFKTDNREQISEDSLRNKSYNFDESTVNQMKDLVKGLMGVVMRY